MRIIAGERRGHSIDHASSRDLRPTSDRVREAIFSILGDTVIDALVLDLFAGTGALGLEALSRGAARAIFVERDRDHAALIRRNLGRLRYEDRATIIIVDAHRWAKSFQMLDTGPLVVFLDPPYREIEQRPRKLHELIQDFSGRLPEGSTLVVESGQSLEESLPSALAWDHRRYGSTHVAIRTLSEPPGPQHAIEKALTIPPRLAADPRLRFALEVVATLRREGHQALWAGGCVRDLILGGEPSDYDVATDAHPDQVMRVFRRTIPVGVSFGVVRVLGPPEVGEVEVATFRSDGVYLDGRRPESVRFGSAAEDAQRRDFTINGMFLDPLSETLLDYVGGSADLERGVIRAIGVPEARFEEDKLRLLRAIRFAARFGFSIETATYHALEAMAEQVRVVAPERIAQELRRLLTHRSRARGVDLARKSGILGAVLPIPATADDDAWARTLKLLDQLPDHPSFPLAFAALFVEFSKHAERGPEIVAEASRALKLSNAERERAVWLVENHDALDSPRSITRARLKRLLAAPGSAELLALQRAQAVVFSGNLDTVEFCERYVRDEPDGPLDPPPLVTGNDLVALGMKPGPRFKALLEAVRERQLEGSLAGRDDALAWLAAARDE